MIALSISGLDTKAVKINLVCSCQSRLLINKRRKTMKLQYKEAKTMLESIIELGSIFPFILALSFNVGLILIIWRGL